jgi:hypothetical protein
LCYFPQLAPCVGWVHCGATTVPAAGGGPSLGSRCPLKICSGQVLVTSHTGGLQKSLSQFAGSWQGYRKLSLPQNASVSGNISISIAHLNSFKSLCIYKPIFDNSKLTILSDRSSGKNFKNPRKYTATIPYTHIFRDKSKVF